MCVGIFGRVLFGHLFHVVWSVLKPSMFAKRGPPPFFPLLLLLLLFFLLIGLLLEQLKKASKKMQRLGFRKINYHGRQGEADRHIHVKMPKFLYTGKRGVGKADWR